MSYFPYRKPINFKLLIPIIGAVLLLHSLGFYHLKNITLHTLELLTPKLSYLGDDPHVIQKQVSQNRQEDIAHIFNRLSAKSIGPSLAEHEFDDLSYTFISKQNGASPFELSEHLVKNTSDEIAPSLLKSSYEYPEALIEDPLEKTFELTTAHAIHHPLSLVEVCIKQPSSSSIELPFTPIGLNEPILPSSNPPESTKKMTSTKRMIANSSDFMVHVEYAPRLKKDGYIFKLSLLPKPHKEFKRIRQNFFFLVDRSHSISPKEYEASKEAIAKVLSYLHPEDTFNILIFDRKVVKLSHQNIPLNSKNIAFAKSFLKSQKHGGFFATTDLYSSLGKIIPEIVEENEVNTAILISDGDTFLNKEKQRKTLNQWTQNNKGKISLFCLAIGKKVNVPLLDILSIFNKGSIRVAKTPNQITPQLFELIQSLNSPIGKELVATILPHHSSAQISLYPSSRRMPNLYKNLEYVLYGVVDKPSDFTLFLQGQYYENWLDIKKTISLSKGVLTDESCLKKNLLLQQAYQEYEQFLHTGHPEFLTKAKELLQPIRLPLAFE